MAARTRKIRHDDETRAKIQTSQIINRLENHFFNGLELSATQVRVAEILLRKTLPDLTNTTIAGDKDNPLEIRDTFARDTIAERLAGIATAAGESEAPSKPH